jgi:hypothetical protein
VVPRLLFPQRRGATRQPRNSDGKRLEHIKFLPINNQKNKYPTNRFDYLALKRLSRLPSLPRNLSALRLSSDGKADDAAA